MNPNTNSCNQIPIPFAKPCIGIEEEQAVLEVMRSGWITTGKITKEFEVEFANFVDVPKALAVNSATSGLHLCLHALGIGNGDLLLTSPYTFASTAAVARHLGAEVVFCDIADDNYNLDVSEVEKILHKTPNIKAILPIHIGGYPCDIARLQELTLSYAKTSGKIAIIEDAAHAFPVHTQHGMLGTLGDFGVYSFYATKTITTAEGGMIVGKDEELMKNISQMRMHGIDREVWDRYRSVHASWKYDIMVAGFKYNLPDILSAIGREQLKKANLFRASREYIARQYIEAFKNYPCLKLPPNCAEHSWHLFSIKLQPELLQITRDQFIQELQDSGIGASVHFIPLHIMSYWSKRYRLIPEDFPKSHNAFLHSLSLPIWHGMKDEEIHRVIETVIRICKQHSTL